MQKLSPKTRLETLGIRLIIDSDKLQAGRLYGHLTDTERQFIREHRDELYESVKNQGETARQISSILSGLYQQYTDDEWRILGDYHSEWYAERCRLENELDGHFLNNDPEAGRKIFYQLVDHLKSAPILDGAQELRK